MVVLRGVFPLGLLAREGGAGLAFVLGLPLYEASILRLRYLL